MTDDDFVKREARRRETLHSNAGDYRNPVGEISGYEANLKGLRGEEEFGRVFNLPIRCLDDPGGDGGWEFILPMRVEFKVDVKTASKPVWLITKEGHTVATTIYGLAHYLPEDRAELLGWQWGRLMLKTKPRPVGSRMCHWWPRQKLRSMDDLMRRRV